MTRRQSSSCTSAAWCPVPATQVSGAAYVLPCAGVGGPNITLLQAQSNASFSCGLLCYECCCCSAPSVRNKPGAAFLLDLPACPMLLVSLRSACEDTALTDSCCVCLTEVWRPAIASSLSRPVPAHAKDVRQSAHSRLSCP